MKSAVLGGLLGATLGLAVWAVVSNTSRDGIEDEHVLQDGYPSSQPHEFETKRVASVPTDRELTGTRNEPDARTVQPGGHSSAVDQSAPPTEEQPLYEGLDLAGIAPSDDRPRVPYSDFEAKYAGASRGELRVAKARVEEDFLNTQQAAVAEMREAGRYMLYQRERPDSLEEAEPTPIFKPGLIQATRARVLDDGMLELNITVVPWTEFLQLYEKRDELFWLGRKISQTPSGQ